MATEPCLPGHLYVVATPIGNLQDITARAVAVLAGADLILAEDTRTSARLLRHLGVRTPASALHEHNERGRSQAIIAQLQAGQAVALISDAGTPLISDPGYVLVREARAAGLPVVPVPGASSVIAALSVSGLPTDRFSFHGFLPPKSAGRRKLFGHLEGQPGTVVLFEAPHRIADAVDDAVAVLGRDRPACLARELTKQFETVLGDTLGQLADAVRADANQRRGEMVLMIGPPAGTVADDGELDRVLSVLLEELPTRQAAGLASRLLGIKRNAAYARALELAPSD